MTNLDPNFTLLPVPKPPKRATPLLKKWLRLTILHLIGPTLRWRTEPNTNRLDNILLIRPDHLGDLLYLTPAIRYLRDLLPQAHLTLMVGPWGRQVVQNNPHLDEILECEFPGFTRQPKESIRQPYRYLAEQAKQLHRRQFDQAIILRFDHWWGAWLAAAAGIPRRFGYAIPEVTPFLTDVLPYKDQRHEVEQNWRLVHFAWSRGVLPVVEWWSEPDIIGPTEFFVSEEDQVWADRWLEKHHLTAEQRLVVVHPGAGAPVKLWRVKAWAELIQTLMTEHACQIVLSGSPGEVERCREIAAQVSPSPVLAAGQTSLSQLAALMRQADLVIGPDTGPVKLAAAVGASTLQLYGPVDSVKFGPWGKTQKHRFVTSGLSCLPCNHLNYRPDEIEAHYCVRGISVQAVLAATLELLKGEP